MLFSDFLILILNYFMQKFSIVILLLMFNLMFSQVGINTNNPKATLDIQKGVTPNSVDGFITIRISGNDLKAKDALYGADQNSTVVYVTEIPTTPSSKTSNITNVGFYYYHSTLAKWMALQMPKFFYMPSIYFDTTVLGTFTKDLYDLYYKQFTNPTIKSTGAFGKVPVLGKTDLEYYITYLDPTVFKDVTIDAEGRMTYTIISNATDLSFLNIVFVVK